MMYKYLESNEYPALDGWEPLDYEEWVKRSYITSLIKTEEFNAEIQGLIYDDIDIWYENSLLASKIAIPQHRLIHHFSGQIREKGRAICFALNPKAGFHIVDEFKRLLFQIDDYTGLENRNLFPADITSRLKSLEDDPDERKRAADFFWKDECEKLAKTFDLINMIKRRGESTGNLWQAYKNIFSCVLKIKNEKQPKNDEIWLKANDHIVIIDVIPYFTGFWNVPVTEKIFPYLNQMLQSLFLVDKSVKNVLFFGASYISMFLDLQKSDYRKKVDWTIGMPQVKKKERKTLYGRKFNLKNAKNPEYDFNAFFLPFPRQKISEELVKQIKSEYEN